MMDLQQQFARLQQQQQQKLEKRKKRKDKSDKENKTDASIAFGINDDLGLQLAEEPKQSDSAYSEELVNHLNDQIRELKDETGRLYKLLSERDMEIRQMKRKREQEKNLMNASGAVAADGAASKIVELSKKVRELSAELESEKSKSKQWAKKCFDLENQMSDNTFHLGAMSRTRTIPPSAVSRKSVNDPTDLQQLGSHQEAEMKTLQDKLKQSEQKLAEVRNQCQSLRQELKVAQKVLSNEVGEGVTTQSLLNSPSGWRGRAQQILALQKKVNELKGQIESMQSVSRMSDADLEAQFMGSASSRRTMTTLDERHRDQLRKVEKERKDAQEKMANEFKALEVDFESTKNKLDASKARNKVLTTEIKALKQQLATVLEKGRHDDELIAALMKQQANLKEMFDKTSKKQDSVQKQKEETEKELQIRQQQDNNVVAQLQAIVADKEAKVRQLEEEIKQCKLNNLQKAQMNGVNALFDRASSRTGSAMSSARPGSSSQVMEDGTIFSDASPVSSARGQRSSSRQNFVQANNSAKRPSSRRTNSRQNSDLTAAKTPTAANQEELEELQLQLHEIRAMYQATEVERDRLSELVSVLEKRVDDATGKVTETQNELQAQKRKNVLLEKQLGKVRIEQGTSKPGTAAGRKGTSKIRGSAASLSQAVNAELIDDPSLSSATMEELQTNLAIQKDENEALKAALQRTLKAKEEDLRLYNEIMEETKKVFLHGLRQYRQGQNQ